MDNYSDWDPISRRKFTRQLGRIGIGGALVLAGCGARKDGAGAVGGVAPAKLRKLGKTDLVLSTLGFGAQHTRDAELIRYALDQGVNHIET
ncbi:MAG: hypothetical protein ACREIC_03005, partial [Limisphaerales bacterium]